MLRVVLRSFLKTLEIISFMADTLQLPPTTSTASISSTFRPARGRVGGGGRERKGRVGEGVWEGRESERGGRERQGVRSSSVTGSRQSEREEIGCAGGAT